MCLKKAKDFFNKTSHKNNMCIGFDSELNSELKSVLKVEGYKIQELKTFNNCVLCTMINW